MALAFFLWICVELVGATTCIISWPVWDVVSPVRLHQCLVELRDSLLYSDTFHLQWNEELNAAQLRPNSITLSRGRPDRTCLPPDFDPEKSRAGRRASRTCGKPRRKPGLPPGLRLDRIMEFGIYLIVILFKRIVNKQLVKLVYFR